MVIEPMVDVLLTQSAHKGQLVLLADVLRWAHENQSLISPIAMSELIAIAKRYGA